MLTCGICGQEAARVLGTDAAVIPWEEPVELVTETVTEPGPVWALLAVLECGICLERFTRSVLVPLPVMSTEG